MELILEQFPTLDPLTSYGFGEEILQTYHRHNAFRVLAVTSTRLRAMFLERAWKTRVLVGTEIRTLAGFLGRPETPQVFALHVGCVLSFT